MILARFRSESAVTRANGMPSGFAVALGGVCLEIQNRSRLNLCDFGQWRPAGRFGPLVLRRRSVQSQAKNLVSTRRTPVAFRRVNHTFLYLYRRDT